MVISHCSNKAGQRAREQTIKMLTKCLPCQNLSLIAKVNDACLKGNEIFLKLLLVALFCSWLRLRQLVKDYIPFNITGDLFVNVCKHALSLHAFTP